MIPRPMIPGEIITAPGEIELNPGLPRTTLEVANTGDRPIQVGSHYHFAETNPALHFDRTAARGQRLDIAARDCQAFDALPGYRMQRSDTGLVLERQAAADLAAGQRRALGWARCSELDQGGIHVRP